jgi:hypothetical protein
MDRPIWLYWENLPNKQEPSYITLCRWTILHNWSDNNLIFLNSDNIEYYLPGIKALIGQVEVDVKGRLDLLKRKIKPNSSNLAVACDVYRANILKKYGGVYADTSIIALKSLTPYFDLLDGRKSFIASRRDSHGKSHIPVSFYGCKPNSVVINSYVENINELVANKNHFHYNELGATALTPIVDKHQQDAILLQEKDIMPVTFESASLVYNNATINPDEVLPANAVLFKLFNEPFKKELSNQSVEQLYNADNFLGKLFRIALPKSVFNDYLKIKF